MLIYLIGLPGSGKTTLGKPFAEYLRYDFLDMDDLIKKNERLSITDIFDSKGEDHFRTLERTTLHKVSKLTNTVISTGGGAPCFFDNMDIINSTGRSVYINVTPKEIVRRLLAHDNAIAKRPLIKWSKQEDLFKEIEIKLNNRMPYYKRSDITLTGDKITVENLINAFKKLTLED